MIRHLSPEQISRWMMGEYTAQEEEHVRDCWTCSAEVNRVETALWLFRGAAQDLSRAHAPEFRGLGNTSRARHGLRMPVLRWALAGLTLILLAGIPVETMRQSRQREARTAQIDAALLDQVDAGVSRAVPAPMEPLASLVAWKAGAAGTTGSPQTTK